MAEKRQRTRNPNGSGTIGPRKDGRYELKLFVDTPDGRRKRISVYGASWEEADAERTRLKELQRKGIPVDVTTMTVGKYLQQWLEDVARHQVRPTTYRSYEQLVRLYLVRQDMMSVFQETQAVLKQQPGNARALSYQALVRLAMGQAPQAEAMLKQALAKDPKLLDAYLHLMLVYVRSEKQAQADTLLKDVQQRFPEQAESFRQLLSEMRARKKDEPQSAQAPAEGEDPHARVPGAGTGARGAAPVGKMVSGTLELDPSISGKSFAGAIVFVTLREGGFGAGPPLAAKRLPLGAFPMPFQIGASDSMTGESLPNDLLIEARIDTDGDPMTRPRSDPYGSADRIPIGTKDVKLVLKPRPAS